MSWIVSDYEGKTCYERCDGIRVFDTDSITAIEQHEKAQMDKLRQRLSMQDTQDRYMDEYYEKDIDTPVTTGEAIVSIILLIGFIALMIVSAIKG